MRVTSGKGLHRKDSHQIPAVIKDLELRVFSQSLENQLSCLVPKLVPAQIQFLQAAVFGEVFFGLMGKFGPHEVLGQVQHAQRAVVS